MEKLQAIKGTYDILPEDSVIWQYIEDNIRGICELYGYGEIRIPVFENTALFARGVGDTTDVVQKEMYTFTDKGNRSITLRPEGTSGVVRSVLEHSLLSGALPLKMYYNLTCYRNEKPQAGRYREFRQFGVEAFGSSDNSIDAEIISLAVTFLKRMGLKGLKVKINSIGCPSCRAEYNKALKAYLGEHLADLCPTCNTRFEKNPMRIIDCKEEKCKKASAGAPRLLNYICDECKEHFEGLKDNLELMEIAFEIDSDIVRGLDYYTKTVFEITSDDLGAQSTVCGGGRYDGLVEQLGGQPTPGIGFGLGIERLIMCMKAQGVEIPGRKPQKIFVCNMGENAKNYVIKLTNDLRQKGISASCDNMKKSLKAQMKYADKIGFEYTAIVGDNEIETGMVNLKNMATGENTELKISEIATFLKGGENI
ncbi:MAG: histidine--tRNA ligase [Monoglobales bacterium]